MPRGCIATRHDCTPSGTDAALLVDVDLAILGAAPLRFSEYERQIREEYSWVPFDDYRTARARILAAFLDGRASVYTTASFQHLEPQARVNLSDSLLSLTA